MKSLIVVHSYHHSNTLKVAKAMANEINADLKTVEQAQDMTLNKYDLVGFGAGIDSGMHYKQLLDFANKISTNNQDNKCFIFSTSAVQGKDKVSKDHLKLRQILISKKYEIVDEFSCKGVNTNSFLKFVGGMNKMHPNDADLNNARRFAARLISIA